MDSYDIFKKLTKGAIFKKETNHQKPQQLNKIDNSKLVIKTEKPEREPNNEHKIKDVNITLLNSIDQNHNNRKIKKKNEFSDKKKAMLEQEDINHYRNINNISVVGRHIAVPIKEFSDLDIEGDLISNINKCGYTEPTPIQKQAIPIMLDNRQLLACAPTGSGKTAAFLLPIIHKLKEPKRLGFRAVIIAPTRELAKQIHRECIRLADGRSLKIHIISKINKVMEKFGPSSSQKFDILVTTPNRLCFLLNQEPAIISLSNVEWLIIDEADKLFESGIRGFREQLNQILAACSHEKRRIAMFSATHTPAVAFWCRHNMKGLITVTVGHRNAATDTVDQSLLFVGNEPGKLLAIRDLVKKGLTPPVLIFVQSKERAQQLFSELIYDGINVDIIHADRTQSQRDNTVRAFREGQIWVLICTELMARGIDFKGVNLIINYDFPPTAISYVHRIGRAGRAGKKGKAITFFTKDDTINLRSIAQVLKQSGCDVPDYMLALKKRGKRDRKRLEISAPEREDISTIPMSDLQRRAKRRQKVEKMRSQKGEKAAKKLEKQLLKKSSNEKDVKVNTNKFSKLKRTRKVNKTPKKKMGINKKKNTEEVKPGAKRKLKQINTVKKKRKLDK